MKIEMHSENIDAQKIKIIPENNKDMSSIRNYVMRNQEIPQLLVQEFATKDEYYVLITTTKKS